MACQLLCCCRTYGNNKFAKLLRKCNTSTYIIYLLFSLRKLKNRVAAQTARDRKKAMMSDLEIQVAKLMEENKRLQRENSNLKHRSSALLTENSSLKERLGSDGSLVKLEEGTSGSAVSSVSLPRGHAPSPSLPVMPYVLTLW